VSRKRRKQKRRQGKAQQKSNEHESSQVAGSYKRRFEVHERIAELVGVLSGAWMTVNWFFQHRVGFVWGAVIVVCSAFFAFGFWYTDHASRSEPDNANVITPDSKPRPFFNRNFKAPDDKFLLILGDFLAWKTELPMIVLMQREEPLITLNKEPRGMSLSAKFFNANGKIVAEIDRNEIHPNPVNFWRLKKTEHRVTIFDDEAKVVVDVQYLNPKTVKILGRFFARDGLPIALGEHGISVGASRLVESAAGEFGKAALSIP
jgi:hypothetical protein